MTKSADMMGLGFAWPAAQALGLSSVAITGAGTTSTNATVCDNQNTVFIVTVTGSDGIRMNANVPPLTPIYVINPSASAGKVYPPTGGTVNGGSTDAGETLTATSSQIWIRYSSTAWGSVNGA